VIQGNSYGWGDLLKVADEAGFTPLPIGDYDVVVSDVKVQATNSGKDSIVVHFQVITGPSQGRKIRNQFTISPENPNAVGFFFRHMAALGLPREYFNQNPTLPQVAQTLLNRPCRIKVTHREWGGATRDNVDSIMPAQLAAGLPQPPQPNGQAPAPAAPVVPTPPVVPVVAPPVLAPTAPAVATPAPSPVTYSPPPVPVPVVGAPPAVAPAAPVAPVAPPVQIAQPSTVPPELPF
jgi:Protein of unknown function (DUF669)